MRHAPILISTLLAAGMVLPAAAGSSAASVSATYTVEGGDMAALVLGQLLLGQQLRFAKSEGRRRFGDSPRWEEDVVASVVFDKKRKVVTFMLLGPAKSIDVAKKLTDLFRVDVPTLLKMAEEFTQVRVGESEYEIVFVDAEAPQKKPVLTYAKGSYSIATNEAAEK